MVSSEVAARIDLVPIQEIREATERLRGVALRTPLLPSIDLGTEAGAEVRLKCESLQRAGAFKIRGAYNFLAQLDADERARGVVAYSSGNHAQGVALAAGLLGISTVVVMPVTAPAIKQDGARRLGAEVVLEGHTSVERKHRAEAIARETGRVVVPGFDDRRIIAGQGSIGVEIAEDWPAVDTVVVPCGGGGMISGIAVAIKAANPDARVIGVEPSAAPSMTQARAAGVPVLLAPTRTIADGLAAVRVSDLTLAHSLALVDDMVTVEEDAIRESTSWLFLRQKLVVEYSGAAGVAAVRSGLLDIRGRRVAIVLSGGNIDPIAIRALFTTEAG